MSAHRWTRALVALGISLVLACGSKGSSTGVTLTISILTRDFVVDELRVRAEVPGLDPTEVRRKLDSPAGDSETVNLLFDSNAAGREVTIIVEAFSNDVSVLTGRTSRTLERDKYVTAEVRLAECAAPDGPFCDADTLVACDAGGLHTIRTVCQLGCNETARRCNTCVPSTAACQGTTFVTCGEDGVPLFSDNCVNANEPCRSGTCTANGCVTAPARQGETFCTTAQIATTCDNAGNSIDVICEFGCNAVRNGCNDCDPAPAKLVTCRADIENLCNAQVICGSDGLIVAKTCCSSNQCTCDGTLCLEDTCNTAPEVGGGGIFSGDLCTGADNVPGDCYPGGVACKSIAAGGQPEKFYRLTLDDQNPNSTFYNVTLDTSGSAAATDLRVSTVCGNETLQVPNAETCALVAGTSAGRACVQDPGPDVLLLCGLPEGEYFGAVDVESGSCSSCPCSYALDVSVTPVTLDTAPQAGNISRGGVFRGNTCALGDQFSFPTTTSVTGCTGVGNCTSSVCPACSAAAATDCRVGATDSLCSFSGAGGKDAVFYLALPVDSGVDISTDGSRFDTVLYILESGPSGALPSGAVRVCNDDCFATDGASHIQTSLGAGLYYVILDGAAGSCGDYVLDVTVSPAATCPNLRCDVPLENCQTCPGDCRCQRCGDGQVQAGDGEACDDGNNAANDGCSAVCVVEAGYKCSGAPSTCVRACGDGVVDLANSEECDDFNALSFDGCSSTCVVEPGSICLGTPSVCSPGARVSSCPELAVLSNSVAVTNDITVPPTAAFTIADATVDVDIAHTYIGDLLVTLKSPATTVTLHNHTGGSADDIVGNFDATLTPDGPGTMNSFNGGASNGVWTLSVTDTVSGDDGTLHCWAVNLRPAAACGNGVCEAGSETCLSCPGDCPCTQCGNGILQLAKGERCDDGNTAVSDGCSDKCQIESGYICEGAPSVCALGARLAECVSTPIPDNNNPGITRTLSTTTACPIGNITADIDIAHTYIGDLIVDLIAPDNTTLHLHNRTGDLNDDIIGNYDLNIQPDGPGTMDTFNGKATNGSWKLNVSDRVQGDTGTLRCWAVNLYCQ